MPDAKLLSALLVISLILSCYLLWILHQEYKPIYGPIAAWKLIFTGYVLLFVETLIGVMLVMNWLPVYTRFFNVGFCAIMVTKVACYVVGFKLWTRKRRSLLSQGERDHERER